MSNTDNATQDRNDDLITASISDDNYKSMLKKYNSNKKMPLTRKLLRVK